jgi:pimeloyl-ACP methyl ester carboxylesterase
MQETAIMQPCPYSLKYPHWLQGVILTDTIIFPVSQYPKLLKMLNVVNSKIFNLINSNFNLVIKILTTSGVKKRRMTREEKDTYKAMFNTKQARRTSIILLHQLAENELLLSRIQNAFETAFNNKPALLIYGENDSLTKLKVPQRIHSLMRYSELHLIPGEGHFPHEGAPDEMNEIITNWLKKLTPEINVHLQFE